MQGPPMNRHISHPHSRSHQMPPPHPPQFQPQFFHHNNNHPPPIHQYNHHHPPQPPPMNYMLNQENVNNSSNSSHSSNSSNTHNNMPGSPMGNNNNNNMSNAPNSQMNISNNQSINMGSPSNNNMVYMQHQAPQSHPPHHQNPQHHQQLQQGQRNQHQFVMGSVKRRGRPPKPDSEKKVCIISAFNNKNSLCFFDFTVIKPCLCGFQNVMHSLYIKNKTGLVSYLYYSFYFGVKMFPNYSKYCLYFEQCRYILTFVI